MIRVLCMLLAVGCGAWAQPGLPAALRDAGIDQRLNAQVPLDLEFRNETGQTVKLSDYVNGKPVILSLVYYGCPMLCSQVLNGVVKALKPISLSAGRDFNILTVSFDPGEGPELAASKRQFYLAQYGRESAKTGWHFLTGQPDSIKRLTNSVGFHYTLDPNNGQYAHSSAVILLTPGGRVSRYLFGIEYPPSDLRLALVEASGGRIGSAVDHVLLFCYHYDPTTGKYGLLIMNVIRLLGLITVVALASFILLMTQRERRLAVVRN